MFNKKKEQYKYVSFEEALRTFQHSLIMTYGPDAKGAIVKIGLEPRLYTAIMMDIHKTSPYMSSFTVTSAAEPQICEVTVLPRERKKEF